MDFTLWFLYTWRGVVLPSVLGGELQLYLPWDRGAERQDNEQQP